jgi:tRNA-specific 2-thiouridylase
MAKIAIGLSGGVDSAVAAHLLKEQGHDVIALFMQNWDDPTGTLRGDCEWEEDFEIAQLVARHLDIPIHHINLSSEYKSRVADYMFAEYEAGRTPNPDVLCNREIKWDVFLKAALEYDVDLVATGHYCQKDEVDGEYRLLMGKDSNKDQSYFLCQLDQEMLRYAHFPIGGLSKPEVRELAKSLNLPNYDKKDSQGLCFIGKIDLPTFLKQKLEPKKGDVIEIPDKEHNWNIGDDLLDQCMLDEICYPAPMWASDGHKLGTHDGAHFFTVGQRRGLAIGGTKLPLFVIGTDVKNNIIYTGQGENHYALNRPGIHIKADEVHWVRPSQEMELDEIREYDVKIRYRQPNQKAKLIRKENGMYIVFDELQKGVAAGQFAVWYDGDELVGSGVIFA